ncbi:MAG: endonuclease VII domain-containing protein [Actinomycetota bacterium]
MPQDSLFSAKKRCPDCKKLKSSEDFPRNKNYKDGRHPYCKPCHNARGRESKDRLYGGSRHYHLKRRYGIGAAEVDERIRQQGGVCAICRSRPAEHVDHNHRTGKVRGILCFGCNGGLGQFQENATSLRRAIDYVERDGFEDDVQEHAAPYILSVA